MPIHTIFNERPESQNRAIKVLEGLGYTYTPRAQAEEMRGHLSRVLFEDVLRDFLKGQSFSYRGEQVPFSDRAVYNAIRDIDVPLQNGLMDAGKTLYDLLRGGGSYEEALPDGGRQSFDLSYINWEHPERNTWHVTDEFAVERPGGRTARPDIVLLVNGIPLVAIECKKSSVDVSEGVRQNIRNWHPDYIPHFFKFIQLVLAMNPNKVLYGTSGTPEEFFTQWREEDRDWQERECQRISTDEQICEQDRAIVSLLSPARLLELIRHFILYDNHIKKIARYQQYFGVRAAMSRIRGEDGKHSRGGVIWHTQGSGKSLTMVMLVKKIQADSKIRNPRFVLVTDRINLDKQLRDNFINTQMHPHQARTGSHLIKLITDPGVTIITTLVHKFMAAARKIKVPDDNIILLVDESHRSHLGEMHILMNQVFPNAVRIGFTGTPLLKNEKQNTYFQFGPLIDQYTIEDGVVDKVIVPLVYEGRIIPQDVPNEKINDYLKYITAPLNEMQREDLKRKWSRYLPLSRTEQRLNMIAFDVHEHFLSYCKPKGFKAILTASSRPAAIYLHRAIQRLGGIRTAAVISPENSTEEDELTAEGKRQVHDFFREEVEPLFKNNHEAYEDWAKDSFVDGDEVDMLIVRDKLLTGFDAPVAAVLYVDKPMKEHTLLQAIARVNRVHAGKDFGLIVDYWGLFEKLHTAMDMYTDTKSGMDGYDRTDLQGAMLGAQDQKARLEQAHVQLLNVFEGIDPNERSSEIWQKRLKEDGVREKFYECLSIFSRLMEMAMGSYCLYQAVGFDKMQEYKHDLLFFQKLRGSVLIRYNDGVDFKEYEDGIRNLLNNFVLAEPSEIVVEPVSIMDRKAMDAQLDQLGSKEAKADAIRTRLVSELETKRHDDPILFRKFSDRIKQTLEEYRQTRNQEVYYANMETMAEDFREGFYGYHYPSSIERDGDAKAFYGAVMEELSKKSIEITPELDEEIGQLSLRIKDAVSSLAKVDWRYNVTAHKKMEQKMDDEIWDFADENGIELTVEDVDTIIENLMKSAMKRY